MEKMVEQYEGLCKCIATGVLDSREDVEECVNDTWLNVWNSIPPARPNSLKAYVSKTIRNISINRFKYNMAGKRQTEYTLCVDELAESIAANDSVENIVQARITVEYIEEFLNQQKKSNRIMFVKRYFLMESFEDIAKEMDMKPSAVKMRLSRLRQELIKFIS
jgi:RNA polymerase sigma-70 factor (ECF subfamily)